MNKKNLTILADYLDTVNQDQFNMAYFVGADLDKQRKYAETSEIPCGTTACALGYGPAAGLPLVPTEFNTYRGAYIFWREYCARVFNLQFESPEGKFIFDMEWANYDNSPKGAATRIRHLIKKGLPADFKHNDRSTYR